jgi:predicted Fe-Mo cluster-binding NifX family protein
MNRLVVAVPVVSTSTGTYVYPHFGRAQEYAIAEVSKEGFRVVGTIRGPRGEPGSGRSHEVVGALARSGVNAVVVSGIGAGAFWRLRELGIKVYALPEKAGGLYTLEEALRMLAEGSLRELAEPPPHEHHHD